MSKEAVSMCKAVRTTIHHCQPLIIPFDFIYIRVIMRVPHWNREGLLVITAFISKCLPFNMLYLSLQSNFSFPVMCKFTSPCMFIFAGTWCNFISSFSDLNLFFLQFWISKIFIFERILKELLMKQLELFLLTTIIPWNLWKVLQQHFTVATFYPEFSNESDLQFFKV